MMPYPGLGSGARAELVTRLRQSGYALVPPEAAATALELDVSALNALRDSWERLPRDEYLLDGGSYRARRHSCFVQSLAAGVPEAVPHRPHWQPTVYNALHGGLTRWFEPLEPVLARSAAWLRLVGALGALFAEVRAGQQLRSEPQPSEPRWYIEAHQFRIDTTGGIGRPTPEGAHRDGVDFVAVILVGRRHVRGGETRVFDAHGPTGVRFTMEDPWTMLLMDDARVIHETTPIQADGGTGVRDTLVITYRGRGFQAPEQGG
jgi:hypothetical protein